MYASLKYIDTEYQNKEKTQPTGTATFMEAVRVEVEKQIAAAAELYWIQRGKDSRLAGPARLASSSTTCYCCTERGHYQRDCKHFKSQCQFCKRIGHLEIASRQKKAAKGIGGDGGGSTGAGAGEYGNKGGGAGAIAGAGGGGGRGAGAGAGEGFLYGGFGHMAHLQEGEAKMAVAAHAVDMSTEFLADTGALSCGITSCTAQTCNRQLITNIVVYVPIYM